MLLKHTGPLPLRTRRSTGLLASRPQARGSPRGGIVVAPRAGFGGWFGGLAQLTPPAEQHPAAPPPPAPSTPSSAASAAPSPIPALPAPPPKRDFLEARQVSLFQLFDSSDYRFDIPPYQRPYAWGTKQMYELLQDFVRAYQARQEYFLGAIVATRSADGSAAPYQLIDGQQRLTSMVLLLSYLHAVARAGGQEGLQSRLRRLLYLEADPLDPASTGRYRLKLRDADDAFFRDNILDAFLPTPYRLAGVAAAGAERPAAASTPASASLAFEGGMDGSGAAAAAAAAGEAAASASAASASAAEEQGEAQALEKETWWRLYENAAFLRGQLEGLVAQGLNLQDFAFHVLRNCFVVLMVARDEGASFRIFSTLNGRGMDLSVVDKLKADLLGALPDPAERAAYADAWAEMEALLGRAAFHSVFDHMRALAAAADPAVQAQGVLPYFSRVVDEPAAVKQVLGVALDYARLLLQLRQASWAAPEAAPAAAAPEAEAAEEEPAAVAAVVEEEEEVAAPAAVQAAEAQELSMPEAVAVLTEAAAVLAPVAEEAEAVAVAAPAAAEEAAALAEAAPTPVAEAVLAEAEAPALVASQVPEQPVTEVAVTEVAVAEAVVTEAAEAAPDAAAAPSLLAEDASAEVAEAAEAALASAAAAADVDATTTAADADGAPPASLLAVVSVSDLEDVTAAPPTVAVRDTAPPPPPPSTPAAWSSSDGLDAAPAPSAAAPLPLTLALGRAVTAGVSYDAARQGELLASLDAASRHLNLFTDDAWLPPLLEFFYQTDCLERRVAFAKGAEALQLYLELSGDAAARAERWGAVTGALLARPFSPDAVLGALALSGEERSAFRARLDAKDLYGTTEQRTLRHLLLRCEPDAAVASFTDTAALHVERVAPQNPPEGSLWRKTRIASPCDPEGPWPELCFAAGAAEAEAAATAPSSRAAEEEDSQQQQGAEAAEVLYDVKYWYDVQRQQWHGKLGNLVLLPAAAASAAHPAADWGVKAAAWGRSGAGARLPGFTAPLLAERGRYGRFRFCFDECRQRHTDMLERLVAVFEL